MNVGRDAIVSSCFAAVALELYLLGRLSILELSLYPKVCQLPFCCRLLSFAATTPRAGEILTMQP